MRRGSVGVSYDWVWDSVAQIPDYESEGRVFESPRVYQLFLNDLPHSAPGFLRTLGGWPLLRQVSGGQAILSGTPLVASLEERSGEEKEEKDNVLMLTSPTPGKPRMGHPAYQLSRHRKHRVCATRRMTGASLRSTNASTSFLTSHPPLCLWPVQTSSVALYKTYCQV